MAVKIQVEIFWVVML